MHGPIFDSGDVRGFKVLAFIRWACWSQGVVFGSESILVGEKVLTLPPIQRSSVWRPVQVLNLWQSLLDGLPIGLLYLMTGSENRKVVTKNGEVCSANCLGYDLLDGQQRLRAMSLCMGDPYDEKRCLWVKFTDTGYELRLTSKAQPFGYDKNGNKLSLVQRRTARVKVEPEGSSLKFLTAGRTGPVFDKDLYDTIVGLDRDTPLANPPYPFGCSPRDTIGIVEALRDFDSDPHKLELKYPEFKEGVRLLLAGFEQLQTAELALMRLDGDQYSDSGKDILALLTRIGAGGTALSQEEQLYSAYKLYKPEVRNTVEKVRKTVSNVFQPARIVSSALRIANTQKSQKPSSAIPDLKTFVSSIKRSDELAEKLNDLLADENASGMQHALKSVRDHLTTGSNAFWLPDVMLADLSTECWQVIAFWWLVRPTESLTDSIQECDREEIVRFFLFWYLCVENSERAVQTCFIEINKSKPSTFPGQALYRKIVDNGFGMAIQHPNNIKQFFLASKDNPPRWLNYKTRFGLDGTQHSLFAARWWQSHRMLTWFQRTYIREKFPDYTPLSNHEDDLPYDRDHICAADHWWDDGTKTILGRIEFGEHIDGVDQVAMRAGRDLLGNSIGNFRLVGSSQNRGDGNSTMEEKLQWPDQSDKTDPRGMPGDFAFDFPDLADFWRLADGPPKRWSAARLGAFQEAVERRTWCLYQRFFDELRLVSWAGASHEFSNDQIDGGS